MGAAGHQIPPLLEFEDDPPAILKPLVFSPQLIVSWGGFTSYQVNVNGQQNNILGDAANEPSLCVDPNNPNRIAIGWRQFDSVASNFRQAGYGYTTDGGLTWNFPGRLENGVFRSDPVLGVRADGTFLYLSLLQTFYDDLWRSLDGGANWLRLGPAMGGDKQWFVVDNTNSIGRGNYYQIWSTAGNNYGGRQFSRSTDAGTTWMDPINIPNQPYWGTLDVDTTGTLYLGGWTDASVFRLVRSLNAKDAGVTPVFDQSTAFSLGGSITYGVPVNPGGLGGQMWLAVDRSSTASPQPVYALCSVRVNASNPLDVQIARSLNGGLTWSAPMRVNDDTANGGKYHWFGTLATSPTGRLDAFWNDTRDDSTNGTSSLYYAYSLDGGLHFSANIRVSPSFNQSLGYPNQNKMGDYLGVVSNGVGANVAYAATFNGEEDIFFLRVPAPVVVAPTSYAVSGGGPFVGSLTNLANSDDSRFILSGNMLSSTGYPYLTLEGFSPSGSPKAILFNFEGLDSLANEVITIDFWNWITNAYETVKTTSSTTTDSVVSALAGGNLDRFVGATGRMRARLHWVPSVSTLRPQWTMGVDQAVWHVIP